MRIDTLPFGPLSSNMYVIEAHGSFFIVDPSVSPEICLRAVSDLDLTRVEAVFITHAHFDHVYCVEEWQNVCKCRFYMCDTEQRILSDSTMNCSEMIGKPMSFKADTTDVSAIPGSFSGLVISVIHTPGHTSGSVCYRFIGDGDDCLFTGDTVFAGSAGRTDFPTGNVSELMNSIGIIGKLNESVRLYPGHGPETDVAAELRSNPYFF